MNSIFARKPLCGQGGGYTIPPIASGTIPCCVVLECGTYDAVPVLKRVEWSGVEWTLDTCMHLPVLLLA